jgi:hypothetical protein
MAKLYEIKDKLKWNDPPKHKYKLKLYYDPNSDNANLYAEIDNIPHAFQFAFDDVMQGECRAKYVKYQGQFVDGIGAQLFHPIPEEQGNNDWQIDFDLDDGSTDIVMLPRINDKHKGLQGSNVNLRFGDIREQHSAQSLRKILSAYKDE